MKVEGGVATTTILHKIKVKEETKECCGYQQASPSCTSAATTATVATVATLTVSSATAITTTVTNSNGVSTVNANPSTTTTAIVAAATATPALQSSSIICHPPTTVANTVDSFPVDLDLKVKSKGDDGETPASSQSTWLARCVSVRFVRRLTAWSRRDKARPTLPLGFCSGLISYPPALPEHPRRYAVRGVFRDSHPHTACTYGVRLTTWSSSSALHPPLFSLLRIF
ncbi:hypothetical protein G5I_04466 [Acromyrmex echinatior]|uniref:Uncharacterized protein n=1 Tax=Acromyrmex echinatior TaxID=103372 RepID=F4WFQ7_ACREC|nr:hypothetical protein G5I_04466 [Acromyrmex echinatior]